jgi:hypothetical protein
MSNSNIARRGAPIATALLTALVLAACGGGGGNPGTVGGAGSAGSTGGMGGTGGTGGTVTAPAPASVQFVVAVPADKSIVIKGQGGSGRTETATLTFKVMGTDGKPLANQQVNFALVPAGSASLNTPSGKTGADGTVTATISSGSSPTTLRVQATLPGTAANNNPDLSTLSDTITVTTGVAVQKAFSISADVFNVEGLNIDSAPSKPAAHVQVLLADAFGNPVADGTPIVFQTNAGAVGSADRGGCTTLNGGCSVDFRAQNPRDPAALTPVTPCNSAAGATELIRPGLATICASSNNGVTTLFDKIFLFLSGSAAGHVYLDSVKNELDFSQGPADLGSLGAGQSRVLWLQIDDVNRNPMPVGTKLTVTGAQGVTAGAISPAAVPNVYLNSSRDPNGETGYSQGSWHQLTITAIAPANCTGTQQATFNVTTTTLGVSSTAGSSAGPTTTDIPFKLSVTCP